MVELSLKGEMGKVYNLNIYGTVAMNEHDTQFARLIRDIVQTSSIKLMEVVEIKDKRERKILVITPQC